MSKRLQTVLFLAVCAAILVFFRMAPESTTPLMPRDSYHEGRQKDYSPCFGCHPPESLPEDHTTDGKTPPAGRVKCYFCHKVEKRDAAS